MKWLLMGLLLLATSLAHAEKRPYPLHRFRWSRAAQTDKNGFYHQPVGLCDDYPDESRNERKVRHDFETMRQAGVSFLRCGIAWESIERAPGQYDWTFWDLLVRLAGKYHIVLAPYVCYTPEWLATQKENFWRQPPRDLKPFEAFVFAIARRYRGKVASWEIWNEPDNHEFWEGTVAQFAELEKAGIRAVHQADPKAVVILGGMAGSYPTPFFQTLKTQYHIEDYVDVVNFHGYNETWSRDRLEDYARQIESMAAELPEPEGTPDLWQAEFGYSDFRLPPGVASYVPPLYNYAHTPAYQAVALFKAHVIGLATGKLSLTAWYRINDLQPSQNVIGDDNNKFLGIVDVAGKQKPAFYALRFYNHLFDQPTRCRDDQVRVQKPDDAQSVVHCIEKKNGSLVVIAWLRSSRPEEVADQSGQATDRRQERLRLTLPGAYAGVTFYRENGDVAETNARLKGNSLTDVTLRGGQIFIAELKPAR